jgi:hypothetical protein
MKKLSTILIMISSIMASAKNHQIQPVNNGIHQKQEVDMPIGVKNAWISQPSLKLQQKQPVQNIEDRQSQVDLEKIDPSSIEKLFSIDDALLIYFKSGEIRTTCYGHSLREIERTRVQLSRTIQKGIEKGYSIGIEPTLLDPPHKCTKAYLLNH